jgi:hypothetical protein
MWRVRGVKRDSSGLVFWLSHYWLGQWANLSRGAHNTFGQPQAPPCFGARWGGGGGGCLDTFGSFSFLAVDLLGVSWEMR